MRTKQELIDRLPEAASFLADQWRSLKAFAARLGDEVAGAARSGQRKIAHNLTILEHWVRQVLLELADHVELPTPRRQRRAEAAHADTPNTDDTHPAPSAPRRPGFRAILPDAYDLQLTARLRKPPVIDITQFAGNGGPRGDVRVRYRKRLAALVAALEHPERYARRVRQVLQARAKRPPVKFLPRPKPRSALPDLLSVPRHSDLGRYLWAYDSS